MTAETTDPVHAALASGNVREAIELLRGLASRGNPGALFLWASWQLIGDVVPRDLAGARVSLRAAVEIGHVDAALLEVGLTANGTGGEPDWRRAQALLKQAADNDPIAQQMAALLGGMAIDERGHPAGIYRMEELSASPRIYHVRALLTRDECAHVARRAADLLEPAVVVDPETGKLINHPVRSSDGAVIGPAREDLVIGAINRRIAAVSETHFQQGEPLAVLRYRAGQQYRPHFDTLPGVTNQRIKTVLIYLNEGYLGGETWFPRIDLAVKGRIGDAIMFDNLTPDAESNPLALHAGLPVKDGVKWLATRWIRQERFDPWRTGN